jgi:hypothetical protein
MEKESIIPLLSSFINTYLCERGIYPTHFFQKRRCTNISYLSGLLIQTTTNSELDTYIKTTLSQIDEWYINQQIKILSLVIYKNNLSTTTTTTDNNNNNVIMNNNNVVIERLDFTFIPTNELLSSCYTSAKTMLIRFTSCLESLNLPQLSPQDIDFYLTLCVHTNNSTQLLDENMFRILPIVEQQQQSNTNNSNNSNSNLLKSYFDAGLFTLTITHVQ